MSNQIVIVKLTKLLATKLQEEMPAIFEEKLQIKDLVCIIANVMATFTGNIVKSFDFTHDDKSFLISNVLFVFANQTYEHLLRDEFIKHLTILKSK